MPQPVKIPAAALAAPPPTKTPDEAIALNTRRQLLLQYAVRINHQVSLLPHEGKPDDDRDADDMGRPINTLVAITSAIKMLSVELRHEYPLPADGGDHVDPSDVPHNVSDDPLAGLVLKFPPPPESAPAKAKPRGKSVKGAKKKA
jgi:hypothetical protein